MLGTCKICLDDDDVVNFINPCNCKGSIKYIHYNCLLYVVEKVGNKCHICGEFYNISDIFERMLFFTFLIIQINKLINFFMLNKYLK